MKSKLNHCSETRLGDGQHPSLPPKIASRLARWGLCGLLLAVVWASPVLAAPVSPGRVLILADTLYDQINNKTISGGATFDPRNSVEAQIARGMGFIVDYAYNGAPSGVSFPVSGLDGTRRQWSSIPVSSGVSPFGLQDYRAILFCDPQCKGAGATALGNVSNLSGPEGATPAWGPVVAGHNIIIDGEDFDYHYLAQIGARYYLTNVIKFVTGANTTCTNGTGLYVSLSCYYAGAAINTPVPVLNQGFGSGLFTVRGGAYNAITITAVHPALTSVTSANLSGYSSSSHETFDTWAPGFTVLAIVTDPFAPKIFSGGGTNGAPYMLASACDGITPIPSNAPSGCLSITNRSVDCIGTNNTYAWSFCITNQFTNAIGWISITDLPSGVTISQDLIPLNPVLQPGQGQCFTLLLSLTNSAVNLTNVCFSMGAHSTDFFLCCSTTNCLTLAPCCAYVPPKSPVGPSESLVPIPGQPNCYNYTVTVRNVSSEGAEYIFFTADPTYGCLTFTPDIVTLPTVLLPNQQVTVTVRVCLGPAPCGRCFLISLEDACCSTRHCLPSVAGGAGGAVAVGSPADRSLFMTPTSIPLAVILTPDIKFSSVSYVANGEVVASNSVPPFSAIWSNAPAGDYVLRADGTEAGGGGVWNSDPVTIYVRTDQSSTDSEGVAPIITGVQVRSAMISFMVMTAPGVTYQVQYSDSIISPNWQPIGEIIVGDGGVSALSYSRTNAPQRFYRVRVQ